MKYRLLTQCHLNQVLPRWRWHSLSQRSRPLGASLLVGGVVSMILSGITPEISRSSILVFSSVAYAQNIPNQEVTNYARAVLAMEPIRQQTKDKLRQALGAANVPRFFACSPEKVNGLSDSTRNVVDNYCNNAQNIVSSNNLTIKQFNNITNAISGNPPADPALKQRVQQELIRLQSQ